MSSIRRVAFGLVLALTTLFAAPVSVAAGATLYVDRGATGCSDGGSGTVIQPFCTIGAAAAKVTAGGTVQVAAGTYPESVTVPTSGTSTAPIVFTAAPAAVVTLNGQANGFVVSSRSWVTINGFSVTKTIGWGIDVSSSSHITISNNRVSLAGQRISGKTKGGIRLSGVTDSLVSGNTSNDNSDYGILLTNSSTRNEVRGNVVFKNAEGYQRAAAGVRLYSSPANTIDANVTHDNEDSGIESYTGSNNTLLFNNVAYANGDHGIDNYHSTGQRVIANTVYKNVTSGINIEGSSTGATLANNISVDNGINSPRTHSNIRIESGSTSGTTMDYDQVYLSVPDAMLIWSSTSYTSLASFQAASHQEAHGLQASPRWANMTAGDFHLTAGSPAIDSANAGVGGQPSSDVEGRPRVDDPATPNTGAGSPPYDDRGAYEFQSGGDAAPVAALSVSPGSGTIDLPVTADASGSTDGDATPIATYTFDFGDGSAPVGPQATATAAHTYTTAGVYTVTVTVRDTAGLAATKTAAVTVTDAAPSAALTVTPATGTVNLDITADASGSSDADATPIAGYRFDFGDGSAPVGPQAAATAAHTYTAAGAYTVRVTVTDTAGQSSVATRTVTVTDSPPSAALTVAPATGEAPLAVTADASGSSDNDGTPIATYTFDFGDGSAPTGPQAAPTASHTYTTAGSYTAKVTVKDTAGLASTATQPVTVTTPAGDAPPRAALTVTPGTGSAPLGVTADASASTDSDNTPIATYRFDFGDGTAAVGPQAAARADHTYTAAGTYRATVTVTDTAGLTGTASQTVSVSATDAPPSAALAITPSSGGAPLAVSADASGSRDDDATPIASYRFDFGDGTTAVGPQAAALANHTYTAAGVYTATVTVTDTAGLTAQATAQVTVSATANLVGNPGFEVDTSGWNTSSASDPSIVLTRVAGGHTGGWSARLQNTGSTSTTCLLNDSPNWVTTTVAGTYTATLWTRADLAGATLKLRIREYKSGTLVGTATMLQTLSTAWQPVTVSYVPVNPGTSTLDLNAYVSSAAPGTCFYADDVSIGHGN